MADLQEYAILVFTSLISIILILTIYTKTRTKPRLPPSPLALPVIGHLHLLYPIFHQTLHKLSTRYGPLMTFFLGSKRCILASSPELVEELLKTNETCFLNRPRMANFDYLTYGTSDFFMSPYGPRWKLMKKICVSELFSAGTLEKLLPIRDEEKHVFLKAMLKKAESGEAVDVREEIMAYTNNTISRMIMSKRCSGDNEKANEMRNMTNEMNNLGSKFNLADSISFFKNLDLQRFGKRLKSARDRYDTMIEKIIKEHENARNELSVHDQAGYEAKDLLDILLDFYEDKNLEIQLTRDNIKAVLLNLFGAGTDTSSITMEWGLSELINHPNVLEKARHEIDSVVGKRRILEESDITNLPYLQAIVKETLRLHPSGPFIVRESTKDCKVAGYDIPADTRLYVNIWALGRDPKHWENPLEFKPERFLGEDWSKKSQWLDVMGQHFTLLPFGSGRRSCPGSPLVVKVVPALLGSMIQCFEWKLEGGGSAVDMEEQDGITLLRARPLVCVPVPRLTPFPSI